jgi:hypothetical protein
LEHRRYPAQQKHFQLHSNNILTLSHLANRENEEAPNFSPLCHNFKTHEHVPQTNLPRFTRFCHKLTRYQAGD